MPSRRAFLGVVVLLVLAAFAARTCQQAQVRIPQERAVQIARQQVDFTPRREQVRLVRQGLNGYPYWAVSLSIPAPGGQGHEKLTTVRIDANKGTVEAVNHEVE